MGIEPPIPSLVRAAAENWAQNKHMGAAFLMMDNLTYDSMRSNIANYFMMVEYHYLTLLMESHNLLLRCRGDSTSRSAEFQHPQGRNHVSFP